MKLKKEHSRLKSTERIYQSTIPVIGLTGGIATGKSTVSEILKSEGVPVICADELVKEIYQKDSTKLYLGKNYPEVISNGVIDFNKLREKFFTDKETKASIENLIYSELPEAWSKAVARLKRPTLIIYDVPLLFEKNLESLFDVTVVVYAPREVQKERLIERDEISYVLAENILNHQMDIEEKKNRAHFILDNSGTIEELGASIEEFLLQIFY